MMRKLTLFLAALCGFYSSLHAQHCGTDVMHQRLMQSSPEYASRFQASNARVAQLIQQQGNALVVNTANGPVYEIPLVIHVIHTGGVVGTTYNPSTTTLNSMVSYLNATYAATWSSYPSATTGGTAFPVQFKLATRGPGCTATTGIVRIDGTTALGSQGSTYSTYGVKLNGANGITDRTLKALSNFDHNDYYNIWIVNKIDGHDGLSSGVFTGGYAALPPVSQADDGTVMLASQAVAGNITIPHEIGHAFGLEHVFRGDDPGGTGSATTCPTNTNCLTDGDFVCDTEPMRRSPFNCPTNNVCTGLPFANGQRNIMDYSNCQDRFTPGQRARFINKLLTLRPGLVSSIGSSASTATPVASSCSPTISNPTNTNDAGVYAVTFSDMSAISEGGYNSDGNRVYIDRTCAQQANVTAGLSYNISVQTGPTREYVRVYIDYSNDGAFNATTELAYSHTGTVGNEIHTGSITIPTTATTCVPLRMRVITDRVVTGVPPTPCIALGYGQAEDYSLNVKPVRPTVNLAFAPGSANPSCAGSALSFNVTNSGTPTSPVWRWYVNGTFTGATGASYTTSSLASGDMVTARLSYSTPCGADSVITNAITVTRSTVVTPSIAIAITTGSNPGCFGTPITFTATPTNGGTAPSYQWYVGSTLQSGITGNSFSSNVLPCNSNVYAVLTSNSSCATVATATSNTISYTCGTLTPSVTISVTGGSNPTCAGRAITFTANPTSGGSAPAYQWFVNGIAVSGATGVSYTNNAYSTGDSVYVRMISNYACASTSTVFSPAVYITTIPSTTPLVTKTITAGSNPGCKDSLIQFTATAINGGAAPTFSWYVNGVYVWNTSVYSNTTASTGDKVWVMMTPSGLGSACFSRDSAMSDTTTFVRNATPSLPFISFIGRNLVSDSANVQWYGPAGLIPGATGPVYAPTATGTYYAVINNPLCGTGRSNVLIVNPLNVGSYYLDGVTVSPNPTTGRLTINWTNKATTRITVYTPAGQAVLRDIATLTTSKVVDLSALASGVYFVNLEDEHGANGTVRITVAH